MNDLVRFDEPHQLTAVTIRAQVNLVQEVMQAVMKKDTHYGTIPGTPKPTLYKPGAEVLGATFRIAVSYVTEDLSTEDVARYRITAIGTHQTSGTVMGSGMGACSSGEGKYKWRKASGNKEFDATPADRRRVQYGYNRNDRQEFEVKQVRTDPADLDNTVLKMAAKRAQVAMILNVTAASDIFTQDIEDLPEELRPQEDKRDPEKIDAGPKPYADADFTKNLPAWTKLITTGKQTAEQIIAKVSSKAVLSEEQKKAIEAVKKPDATDKETGETESLLDTVKRHCAAALEIADKDTAYVRLQDAEGILPEMNADNKALARTEIDAAIASIKARE